MAPSDCGLNSGPPGSATRIKGEAAADRLRLQWPEIAIVLVALVFRLIWLSLKPAHFDEGVNGYFVDQMRQFGYYHYDPTNFHGPLHFYLLFLAQTLLGRHTWALRLPIALISTLCVVQTLAFRRYFPRVTCLLAAAAMAVSPGMTFYGRYAIHESFLLLSLLLTTWGALGMWQTGGRRELWATALGITGMILTKETYVIHITAMLLAFPTLLLVERCSSSDLQRPAVQQWSRQELVNVVTVCFGLVIFFYSGALLDWSSVRGLWETFQNWTQTGTSGKSGHEKDWYYWWPLMARYEWPALFGVAASFLLVLPRSLRNLRYVVIAGWGTLAAYSIIHYKTPWCIITFLWPFYFAFGAAIERLSSQLPRALPGGVAVVLLLHSTCMACWLNFRHFADPKEEYVYVQTLPAVDKILRPLYALAAADPANYHLKGILLFNTGENHPLPWLLGDFTHVDNLYAGPAPANIDSDFLVVQSPFVSDVEDRLKERYYREELELRGNSGLFATVFFNVRSFRRVFPDREPEFEPAPLPAPEPPAPEVP